MAEPKASYETTKSIYDLERCILNMDTPDAPIVYRAPDRPNESLIYYAAMLARPMVIEIMTDGKVTRFVVKHPTAKGFEKRFAVCV